MKTVAVTGLSGLWALEWAWHPADTNLRCVKSSGICMPNRNSLALFFQDLSFHSDRRKDG